MRRIGDCMFAAKRRRRPKVLIATLFDVPTATINSLFHAGYTYLDELEGLPTQELLRLRSVGLVGVESIDRELKRNGLKETRRRKTN